MQNLIFLHIPKTAGATFRGILKRKYKPEEAFFIENHNVIPSVKHLLSLPQIQKDNLSLIMGHIDYGLHKHFKQDFSYLTVFRDPVDRIVSHYNYVKSQPDHYLNSWVIQKNVDLKTYVSSRKTTELNNGMVRMMTGQGGYHKNQQGNIAFGECPEELLEKAFENLEKKFIAFGIQEYFDESILLLSKKLGWGKMSYISQNIAKRSHKSKVIDSDTLSTIEEFNRLDILLYNGMKKIFEEELEQNKEYLTRGKRILKSQNNFNSFVHSSKQKLKSFLR